VAYEIWRALLFEGKKLALALSVWALSLLLLLIPVAGGVIYAAVGLLLGAIISGLDFFDGPQERRRRSFRQKLGTIWATLPGSLSFGFVAFGLVSIPLVNLLAIPLCVAAGNIFVIERALPQATQSARTPGSPTSDPVA
jgi:CysZ protein